MADVADARPVSGAAATIEHGFDDGYQVVPAELEETPAGAALAAVLERLDPRRVSPSETVRLVAAQRRQLAHQQACFHACAREAALADPDAPGGRAERDVAESGDELRAVLSASRTAVARLLDLADAAQRHPRLGAAWRAGEVDEQRVAILVRWTAALSVEHAAAVIAELIDQAGAMTPSRLIDRIQALAKALDPAWAEKLYRQARRQRRVRARCTDAGTVNLSALDLPMPGGVRSVRRINALAARSQAAGRPGLIDTIRADVVLALFHPDNAGADDAAIVAAVLAMGHDDDPRPRRVPDPAQAPPDDPTPPADPTPTDAPTPTSTPTSTPTGDPTPPGSAPPHAADPAVGTDDALGATGGRRPTRQSRFELRVGLNTLLELDERPARLPGLGVITAGLARELAAAHADAEWRVAVTDDSGVLIAALLAGRRPAHTTTTPQQPPLAGAPRPVVELHVSEAGLARLRPREHDGWAPFLIDLQQQLSRWRAAHDEDLAAQEAERRAAEPERPWDDPLDVEAWARIAARRRARAHEALARFPSAALRRWITMRDRSCVFPPCGASALAAEIDHTHAVTDHGRTLPANLDPACGHDHDLKDRGWTLTQPRPGWFRWTSPTGHT
ncbi:HNH endonuclease signature motif containing protein [Actinomycetospora lemnae]|uniref:HNH endonuclease n=1 Tax=Actinomycetospora lemnae TaxID=3019891 RepID=A0ABT5SRK1_9PSEU|nr:HNH endonuclease signature motif containing protein [Actinomycetospora sp. DW7H6]MDD7964771.1 hypothetical protein [Actinomycetospora sp. DW7H6]